MVLRQLQSLKGTSYHQVSEAEDTEKSNSLTEHTTFTDREFYSFRGSEKSPHLCSEEEPKVQQKKRTAQGPTARENMCRAKC